jgi:hypothetical protein
LGLSGSSCFSGLLPFPWATRFSSRLTHGRRMMGSGGRGVSICPATFGAPLPSGSGLSPRSPRPSSPRERRRLRLIQAEIATPRVIRRRPSSSRAACPNGIPSRRSRSGAGSPPACARPRPGRAQCRAVWPPACPRHAVRTTSPAEAVWLVHGGAECERGERANAGHCHQASARRLDADLIDHLLAELLNLTGHRADDLE